MATGSDGAVVSEDVHADHTTYSALGRDRPVGFAAEAGFVDPHVTAAGAELPAV